MEQKIYYAHDVGKGINTPGCFRQDKNRVKLKAMERLMDNFGTKILYTFDDGYKSWLSLLPLARKYDVKILLFVVPGFCSRSVWPIERLMQIGASLSACDRQSRLEKMLKSHGFLFPRDPTPNEVYECAKRIIKHHRSDVVDDLVEELQGELRQPIGPLLADMLTVEDLQTIAKHPNVEIGSHSYSHRSLINLSLAEKYEELALSKAVLEDWLGVPVNKVSYPYGIFDNTIIDIAQEVGYEFGYGTSRSTGFQIKHWRKKFRIQRRPITDVSAS